MPSKAQVAANRENAQHSTGPKTDAGKEASSKNNFRHGLTGHAFFFLEWEDAERFDRTQQALRDEHRPSTPTEQILVEKMAQHYWLSQRAQALQTLEMTCGGLDEDVMKAVNVYCRYEAQHERLFQRALHDLLKLRAEKRKEQIGFESQKRVEAHETRREATEIRKVEEHKKRMEILEVKLDREKSNAIIRAIAAADQMEASLPPAMAKIAA